MEHVLKLWNILKIILCYCFFLIKHGNIYVLLSKKEFQVWRLYFFSELNHLNTEFITTDIPKNGTLMVAQPSVGSAHSIAVIYFLE